MGHQLFSIKKISFMLVITNFLSGITFLLLIFNNGLLGYLAIPILLLEYFFVLCLAFYTVFIGIKEHSFPLIMNTFISLVWVLYGLGSEFFSNGINTIIMAFLLTFALITNVYYHLTITKKKQKS